MRHWLLLFPLVGVVSAVVTSWEPLCTKQTDAIPCTVTEGKAHRNDSSDIVVRPHDLRVEPRVKVSPADGGHLLETVLSWETPSQPRDSVKRVTGFQLAIVPLTGTNLNTRYFLFRIPETVVYINQFQRFVFTSRGLLLFGESYEIRVWSLPMPIAIDSDLPAQKLVQMPFNPDSRPESLTTFDCRRTSHEDAARWVSGFRRLDLFVLQRKLHVWFVAAPPQYCFQQYKLTMTNTQFEETTVFVNNHELVTERFDNVTIRYGEHIFSNLEPGNAYRVSVIAVERRLDDRRCVCPVRALKTDDLRTSSTICSCTNAESEQLYLEHYEPPPPPPTVAPWSNTTAMSSGENLTTGLLFLGMIMLIAVLVVGVSICAITAYFRHLRLKDRAVRIRFIADRTPYKGERAHEETELPFIPKNRVVTIIYAHDSAEHELIVEALARFIGEQLKCSVLLDVWSENDVAKNKAGWIQRSVDEADYIVFVHSVGTRLRYEAAIYKDLAVGRNAVGPLDDIFVPHAHYALQTNARVGVGGHRPSFVHLRFEYTSDASVLTTAMTETVFELPRDATSFVSRMEGAPADALSSRQWLAVQLAMGAMVRRSRDEPDWFQGTHCRLGEPAVPTGLERSSDVDGSRWRCGERDAPDVPTIDGDYVPIKKPACPFGNDLDGSHDSGLAVTVEHSICAH